MLSEREIAKRLGAHVAQAGSLCFDALYVSVREALPASSLTSEALSAVVSSLCDAHEAALISSFAAVAGARAKERAESPGPEAADSSASAREERELDARLAALRARTRNADVAAAELAGQKEQLATALAAVHEIRAKITAHGVAQGGEDLAESADAAAAALRAEALTIDSVRALLEDTDAPLLARAASALRGADAAGKTVWAPRQLQLPDAGQFLDDDCAVELGDIERLLDAVRCRDR